MRNYVSRYATMYRYKWRPDTKHSASELKRSSWVQYIKHWLISSTTHASTDQLTTVLHSCWRLRAAKHVCDHAGYIRSRAKNNTIINTLGKKYDTAWGIEKTGCDYRSTMQRVKTRNVLVFRTMATSHFDHSKSFRPYWENIIACLYGLLELHNHLAKLQTGLRGQLKQLVENLSKFWTVAIFLLKILSNKRPRVQLIKCALNFKIPCFTPHFKNCIGIIDGRDASGYQWCFFGSAN